MGVKGYVLDGEERLKVIHDILNPEDRFIFNFEDLKYITQSTRTYDKEGREIFVGDVLQIDFVKAIVRFGKYRYYEEKKVLSGNGFYLECLNVADPDCISPYEPDVLDKAEIIGNIFENPTLEYHFIGLRPK